jgi:HlyD family secretion protein
MAEERLKRTVIRAPSDGTIFTILARPGESVGTLPLLRMGDSRHMLAVAEVYETDVCLVRVGQTATIASPALSQPLTGVVEQVGSTIVKNHLLDVDPSADADRRVVEVRIRLDQSEPAASMINLQVQVSISLAPNGKAAQ